MGAFALSPDFREYLMEERRLSLDRVAVIERKLEIPNEKEKLKARIRDLERRLGVKPGE